MSFFSDFLKKESIIPVRKLQDFKFLDRDQFMVDHDVEALAKRNGKVNIPASYATQDPSELTFLQELEQHAAQATMILNGTLADIKNSISRIDVEQEKAQLDNVVLKLRAELTTEHDSNVQELSKLRDAVDNRQTDVDRFKKDHSISREAIYKQSFLPTMAWIAIALIIETILNSSLLAQASDFGLVGGATLAILISLINITFGFMLGLFVFPFTSHKNMLYKRFSWVALILASIVIFLFNLLLGHYREVLIQDPNNSAILAIQHFTEDMFNLNSIESIFLIIVGLIVSVISFWKGSTQNDSYPGYTKLSKERDKMFEEFLFVKEEQLSELTETTDDFERKLTELHKKVSADYRQYNIWHSGFQQQQKLYQAYTDNLVKTGEIAISTYRQINQSVRSEEAPKFFSKKIVVTFNQTLSIPEIVDVGPSLNAVVEDFGGRLPQLSIEFKNILEEYRRKIVAIAP